MYHELVKRLWECASGECFNCSQYTPTTNASVCQKELMKQAADAIEEMQQRVPKVPHGRLIDADALEVHDGWLRDSKYFSQNSSHTHITFVYSNDICNATTIIPASEGRIK